MSLFGKVISTIEPASVSKKQGGGAKLKPHTISSSENVIDASKALAIEEQLAQKLEELDKKEKDLTKKESEIDQIKNNLKDQHEDAVNQLSKVAHLTADEAKKILLEKLESDLTDQSAKKVREAEETIKSLSTEKAKEILVDAMLHGATDYVSEYTTSTIRLASEEMKGRIIGKEGRNIRAFEMVTGVDVDLDTEDPQTVRVSSFDSVRREIARVTLEKLVRDTRIQPTRIEEIFHQTKKEIEKIMEQEGINLTHQVGVYNLPIELVRMLGKFKYRFSYGQNMIAHTLEETKIGIAIASEIGADVNVVRLGCLLHDIGKIVIDEEGTHVTRGAEIARQFHMPEEVVACIAQHHEDEPFSSIESMIVYIADAISGSRPGARHEPVEEYIKRLTDIEKVANSFEGVKETYAIQAGREVRVIVEPDKLDDAGSSKLAYDIARKLEKEIVQRPGQIKVTVVREIRASESTKDQIPSVAV